LIENQNRKGEEKVIQSYNKSLIVAVLLAGSFIAILNQTLMITAIPPIMREMHVTANTAQWLTTVFMLVNGVMIPISAFLIERYTTRRLYLTAMGIFVAGTLIASLAPNFYILLVGRIVQSAGAGITLPLMQTIFLLIFPINKRGQAMGLVGLVISFAPAIGPALSGWILASHSWRWLFLIILPIALLIMGIAVYAMKNVTEVSRPEIDVPSFVLSTVGFGGLLYGFTSAGNNGWGDGVTLLSLGLGAVSLLIFILMQLRMAQPILEFRVFKYPVFTLSTIIGMIGFMGLIGSETLIPLFMQNMRGFSAMDSGIAILPGALITGALSPITGRIFDRFGAKWLSVIGLVFMTYSTFEFATLTTTTTMLFITIMYSIRMFGQAMVMMPATTAGLNELPRRLIPHGSAMTNTMRQVAASVGTAILVTVMTTAAKGTGLHSQNITPAIHGVNLAFWIVTALTGAGLVLSFYIKKTSPPDERVEIQVLSEKQTGA
jgi:EmrB/QacA subfamily drug resistance transporter